MSILDCEWIPDPRFKDLFFCKKCGGFSKKIVNRNCPIKLKRFNEQKEVLRHGPGTELSKWLRSRGVPACNRCQKTALRMNELGPEGCLKELDSLAEEIVANVRYNQATLAVIMKHFPKFAQKAAIKHAIKQYGIRPYLKMKDEHAKNSKIS